MYKSHTEAYKRFFSSNTLGLNIYLVCDNSFLEMNKRKNILFQENNTNYLYNEWKQTNKKEPNKKERKLLGNQGILLVAIFDYILDKYIIWDYL